MTDNIGPSPLILGSASPRRRALLAYLGVPFECGVSHDVDEGAVTGTAAECVATLARQKAEAVLKKSGVGSGDSSPRVLGADTVVACRTAGRGEIIGKPRDPSHARELLKQLSGCTHEVYTGVALATHTGPTRVEVEVTQVTFRELSDEEIDSYVASGEPMGKAGAYAIQEQGRRLVAGLRGCYYNVVGLPLVRTARLLGIAHACDCAQYSAQWGAQREAQRGPPGCGLTAC